MKRLLYGLAAVLSGLLPGGALAEDALIAQLGTEEVRISTQFAGKKVLVFGALSRPGDVVIKVVSPPQDVALSHKLKLGPFWLNSEEWVVQGAPGLVYLLSTRPTRELLDPDARERLGLRLESALAQAKDPGPPHNQENWREAFLHLKRADGHYREDGHAIRLVRNRLFTAELVLPADLPLGIYRLETYLVRKGRVVGQQHLQFKVRQVGLERWVSDIAEKHPWLLGTEFTALAMMLGLGFGVVLRR